MAEYFEKDAFVAWIEKQKRLSKLLVIMALEETPAADVAPVVRCKDCKHRFEDLKPEFAKGSGICMKLYDTGKIEGYLCRVNADDFCSRGERKDGDG